MKSASSTEWYRSAMGGRSGLPARPSGTPTRANRACRCWVRPRSDGLHLPASEHDRIDSPVIDGLTSCPPRFGHVRPRKSVDICLNAQRVSILLAPVRLDVFSHAQRRKNRRGDHRRNNRQDPQNLSEPSEPPSTNRSRDFPAAHPLLRAVRSVGRRSTVEFEPNRSLALPGSMSRRGKGRRESPLSVEYLSSRPIEADGVVPAGHYP